MAAALPASEVTPRGAWRVAEDTWLVWLSWLVVALAGVQVLLFGFGRDQSIYAVVADAMLAGKMPYRDAWDFKPPGIFVVYALAQTLFGKAMSSVRLVEVTGLVAMVLAFRRLGRTLFGSAAAGLAGGALAVLIHSELEFWHTAQPESFGGMLTAFALVLATGPAAERTETPLRRAAAWAAIGALFGAAFLLKPPLGGGALVCAAYLAVVEHRISGSRGRALAAVLVTGAASLVPIVLCGLWFWARGAWPALRWTLFEFTPGYTKIGWHYSPSGLVIYGLEEALTGFSYLLPVALGLAVLLPRAGAREREGIALVLGIVSIHVVGIALQAKFFQYHYGATLPLLSLVAGLGLHKAYRRCQRLPYAGMLLFTGAVAALAGSRVALRHNPGTYWERSAARLRFLATRTPSREELDAKLYYVADYSLDTDRRAAREVARLTTPDDTVLVWGFEPAIYWFSGRRPASHYLYDVPQRARWQRERARDELIADVRRSRPRVVLVQHGDYFEFVTGDDRDSYAALKTFPELERIVEDDYVPVGMVDDLDLYLRR